MQECFLNYDTKIKRTISKIKESLTANDERVICNSLIASSHDLSISIIAAESIAHLRQEYNCYSIYFEHSIIHNQDSMSFKKNFLQTNEFSISIQRLIFIKAITKLFDQNKVTTMIGNINWDVKEVATQHNYYIDVIIQVCYICNFSWIE